MGCGRKMPQTVKSMKLSTKLEIRDGIFWQSMSKTFFGEGTKNLKGFGELMV